ELVNPDGSVDEVELDTTGAIELYKESYERAKAAGFNFPAEPIRLSPQNKLVHIIRRSQELALEGEGGEAEAET
ncbi:MAG TPA: type I-U CRISPR-associated protein Cas7, partial [Gammaproteobacteria bacterium]|nr:type I-U CRISPR-associated protein Cas7 [Gammaproteobacteria bacterium]